MNDYKSLRKKNSSRMLALVMAVLVVLEMCSLAVLFSQIATYSVAPSKYVISLTDGADRTKSGTVDTSKTGFIVPTSVVDPDTLIEPSDSVNTYDFGFVSRDLEQVWTTDTEIALFHLQYDNEQGVTTVISENTDKVFAPGTANAYSFAVANTGSHSLDYLVYIEATEDTDGHQLPLVGRLRRGDGQYIVGSDTDSSSWPDVLALHQSGDLSSLAPGASMDYIIDWEWPFERTDGDGLDANDAYDTFLGNLAVDTDLWLNITIKTIAWWEDYWYAYADVTEGIGTASVTPDKVDQATDDTFTFTATPEEGYEFVAWEIEEGETYEIISGSLTDPTLVLRPGSDIHAHATFRPIPTQPGVEYWLATADVKSGEGTATVTPASVEQGSDDTFTFVATPGEDYEFVGWEFDESDVYEIISGSLTDTTLVVKPGSDVHAHAVFRPVPTQPVVEYWAATAEVKEGQGSAQVTPAQVEKNSDGTFTFVATPDDGWEFVGWEFVDGNIYEIISGSLTDPTLVVKPGSDLYAYAIFKAAATEPTEPITYWTATADVKSGDGTATVTPASVEQGSDDTFTFVATPSEGYDFVGWEFDDGAVYEIISGSLTDTTLVVKPGSDLVAHAVFKAKATEPSTEPTEAPTSHPDQPKTGDNTNALLWLIISLVVMAALVVVFIIYYRMRKAEKVGQRFDD